MTWHALAALLVAWLGYRVVTVAVLPFLRERGFGGGPGAGRAFHAGPQDGYGVAGRFVTMAAGAGMLALIAFGAHGVAAGFLFNAAPMDFWPVAGSAMLPLLSLGLVAFALGYSPRGLAGLADCFALAALAALLVYNFVGLAGAPAEASTLAFHWIAAAGFAAAAMILSGRLLSLGRGMIVGAGLVAAAVVTVETVVVVAANLVVAVAETVAVAGMMASPVAFAVAAAAGWCRLSGITVLALAALTVLLLPTVLPVWRIVEAILRHPETYALLPAVFMLGLGRAMAVYSSPLLPSFRREERRWPPVAAFQWLVAAISAIPVTVGLKPFAGGRHVSLAMLLPFGLPMLLMGEIAGSSPLVFATALAAPFLVLLGICVLWPREGFTVGEAAPRRVFVGAALVLAVFWLMFAGVGTVTEVMAMAAGLCCLLLALRAGGYAVLLAQGRAVADCALFALVLLLANVIHATSRLGMMSFMRSDWFLLVEGMEIPAMLALALVLGASIGTLAAMVLLSLLYFILVETAFDIESSTVLLLLAAETGRYARVAYMRMSEGGAVDLPWLLSLAGLTLAYLALLMM